MLASLTVFLLRALLAGAALCAAGCHAFALDMRFLRRLRFDFDPVLLTHEAVAIGRKYREAQFRIVDRRQSVDDARARIICNSVLLFASVQLQTLCRSRLLLNVPLAMPKILIGISILLLTLSLVFGFLNTHRDKGSSEPAGGYDLRARRRDRRPGDSDGN